MWELGNHCCVVPHRCVGLTDFDFHVSYLDVIVIIKYKFSASIIKSNQIDVA